MKILFAAGECVPFIKTGGLADVVGALAPVLAAQGHDVRVMIPLYSAIPEKWTSEMTHECDFEVELGWRRQYCGIEKIVREGVTFYFIDNKYYFGRSYIYGLGGDEYERFGFFDRAVLNALTILDFQPDVVHAHDWQAGMIPALLKIQYAHLPFYANMKTMYTIHNLQYQGIFGVKEVQDILGLGDGLWTNDKLECFGCANFMKAALVYSDVITTVSPSYSEEIQTAYYGERLDGLIRARKDSVFGVLNGIDMVDYDPTQDKYIAANYSIENLSGKAECKRALQETLGLEVRPEVPIIGMVGRLSNQKGLDLVDYIIGDLMKQDVQLVVLGMGDSRYVNLFSWAESQYPGRVAARFAMDNALAHQIYAGADMFLMPSQFEPCGLSQLIALRYGTIPLVRETGGLRDTVLSYNEYTDEGNGFSFFNYNAHDMLHVIERAENYFWQHKDIWYKLQSRGMSGDYSWTRSAGKYLELYSNMIAPATEIPFDQQAPAAAEEVDAAEPVIEEAPVKKPAAKKTAKKAVKVDSAENAAEEKKPVKKAAAKKTPAKKTAKEDLEATTADAEKKPAKKTATKKTTVKKETKGADEKAEATVKKTAARKTSKAEENK